jgi:hypothetical protein
VVGNRGSVPRQAPRHAPRQAPRQAGAGGGGWAGGMTKGRAAALQRCGGWSRVGPQGSADPTLRKEREGWGTRHPAEI